MSFHCKRVAGFLAVLFSQLPGCTVEDDRGSSGTTSEIRGFHEIPQDFVKGRKGFSNIYWVSCVSHHLTTQELTYLDGATQEFELTLPDELAGELCVSDRPDHASLAERSSVRATVRWHIESFSDGARFEYQTLCQLGAKGGCSPPTKYYVETEYTDLAVTEGVSKRDIELIRTNFDEDTKLIDTLHFVLDGDSSGDAHRQGRFFLVSHPNNSLVVTYSIEKHCLKTSQSCELLDRKYAVIN